MPTLTKRNLNWIRSRLRKGKVRIQSVFRVPFANHLKETGWTETDWGENHQYFKKGNHEINLWFSGNNLDISHRVIRTG